MDELKFKQIWKEVQEAAEEAVIGISDDFTGCGFAWINIGGRGKFAKFAKEYLNASKNYGGKGFNIWYTRVYSAYSQNESTHRIACEAGANVLRKYGIKCFVSSRLD